VPDGYACGVEPGSFISMFTPVPDPFRDFTRIAYLGGQPVALFANKDLPYRTLSDLVTYAKPAPARSPTRPSRSDHKRNCSTNSSRPRLESK
jgi:tripartite-type tricarboxylate transporter receptor subunit TctC